MHSSHKGHRKEPIAVIGNGCRFPGGAATPAKLWDLLREPWDVRSTIPSNRFDPDGFFRDTVNSTHHGYFLTEDYRTFDASFFGVKPVEAKSIDPQQRLLLEVVYESIEAAGLSMAALRGTLTAIYVGLMAADYNDLLNRDTSDYPPYIAAGANLLLGPEQFIAGSNMKMLSPDGRSRMWDSKANGYARGDGIAAVVLKTLSAALADGDDIECVIVETGLNQDGRTQGLTVPNATAQAALIKSTYKKAGLDLCKSADRPQYFEAHGTGTPIGDPIEAEAIHTAFFKSSDVTQVGRPRDTLICGPSPGQCYLKVLCGEPVSTLSDLVAQTSIAY
ncbi:hypothetical protein SLS59_006471 [Nothophoma quercina]|uniref:Ketosynthase family 3 (KS3) domain-containing protein n=1 Tax=Nothophoma quercina TaxID=749835 RepID=A0ABR3R4V0_9PLEO